MTHKTPAVVMLATVAALSASAAFGQSLPTVRTLPLSLANEAALAAVAACERSGYHVTATVVDASGLLKAVAKGDGSQPHTLDSSRGKAYSIVTLGPIFGETLNGALSDRLNVTARSAQQSLPGVFLLAGGALLQAGPDVVGAIGVGGAPGGDKDEVCARAGVDAIAARLS
ncbi:MAG: heme-binding protein [Rhodospirillales bacterium]|nr:heme-binding protein [Rhodospirillales bacterium]